jgi:hypothetical protein
MSTVDENLRTNVVAFLLLQHSDREGRHSAALRQSIDEVQLDDREEA